MTTMKAMLIERYGKQQPLRLADVPVPAIGEHEILAEIHAASVNPVDFKIRDGKLKEAGVTKGLIIMKVNDREMRTTTDFDEAVKAANLSTDRVLWIRAKTQTGINKSFAVELSDPKAKKDKK